MYLYWASKLTYMSPAPRNTSSQVANAMTRWPGVRDQVRVDAGRDGGDHVVHEEECPGFLPGQDHGLAAQDAAGTAERFLKVKESDFDLPPLSIEHGDLAGGVGFVVQQGSQQPDGAGL